ncbi:hypothetical protein COL940_009827 [Colletotrichum noveboracense]|nr:hypothetical protein COL940_009827 [Colletotrichum noveboracense]
MEAIPPTEDTATYMNEVDDYKLYWETEDEERPQHYFPGSYHPVKIGDTFSNGRYTIVHKLGHGGYSTVWLARDKSQDQFVALKIMVPEQQSQFELQNCGVEIELLRELHRIPTGHPGKSMLMSCLDSFSHDGPNGTHLCFVSLPHRISVGQSRHEAQDKYCGPEANFAEKENIPLGFPSDVWSLGVGIFELFGGSLFEASSDPDDMLEDMINALGKPPQRWWELWEAKEDFFNGREEWDENGHSPQITHVLLEERLRVWVERYQRGSMTTEEIGDLHELVKQILQWEPEDRPTADELLRGGWMKKWGLPALQAMYEARGESRNITAEIDSIARMELAAAEKEGSTRWKAAVSGVSMPEFATAWWTKVRGLFGFP